jgi:hypothetical protein
MLYGDHLLAFIMRPTRKKKSKFFEAKPKLAKISHALNKEMLTTNCSLSVSK